MTFADDPVLACHQRYHKRRHLNPGDTRTTIIAAAALQLIKHDRAAVTNQYNLADSYHLK